jgi:hypothetical protein
MRLGIGFVTGGYQNFEVIKKAILQLQDSLSDASQYGLEANV